MIGSVLVNSEVFVISAKNFVGTIIMWLQRFANSIMTDENVGAASEISRKMGSGGLRTKTFGAKLLHSRLKAMGVNYRIKVRLARRRFKEFSCLVNEELYCTLTVQEWNRDQV